MIPFDFVYLRPDSAEEAIRAYSDAEHDGLRPYYYGGGTEIVTFARNRKVTPDAVIDIKSIPECGEMEIEGDTLVLGAGLPLNRIISSGLFPLLEKAAEGIADHTVRNRLTLGGNIAGQLPYREAALPLLLSEAILVLAGPKGERTVPIGGVFSQRLKLEPGEFIVQARVAVSATRDEWRHVRREKGTRIDYPVISLCMLRTDGRIRMAASGVCSFPFRDGEVEKILNETGRSAQERARAAVAHLPGGVRDDHRASREYRRHLFMKALVEILEAWERPR